MLEIVNRRGIFAGKEPILLLTLCQNNIKYVDTEMKMANFEDVMNRRYCMRLRSHRTILFTVFGIRYTLYGHGESYRVARAPYSVFGADPMDTSDERDLTLLLLADIFLVFCSRHSLDPIGGASIEPFL